MTTKFHNLINNDEGVDGQVIGIIVTFPITGEEEQAIIVTHEKCKKCQRERCGYGNFCSQCGGEFHTVTEEQKDYRGKVSTQKIPLPDVREDMKALGIEEHLPMEIDQHQDYKTKKWVYTDCWKFVYKEYKTVGHRSDFVPFLNKLDIEQIQKDLEEAKEKFKAVLKKHKGHVIFGVAGVHADW